LSKYHPLKIYLEKSRNDKLTLTLKEIEKILGSELPPSAIKYQQWWANKRGHTQANAWLGAGWKVDYIDIVNKFVTFIKLP